ncbi:signal recognition particle, subunit Srp19 [Moesziomyces antarcticus T-34]|uniref:Signal recognition particle, subunit Srp19 n=1 Tax=Pseudozyma antarctica (strain T-34) TaxID=1151754 RepID=M9MGR9_PSEA3|nr:signal recognition particle, subunit Srp19 [Moesziomyces antarcticus T-34]
MSSSTTAAAGAGSEECLDCARTSTTTASDQPIASSVEDPLDARTFIPPLTLSPLHLPTPLVTIEFGLRANWMQQELLSTFAPSSDSAGIGGVLLVPNARTEAAGRFRVYLINDAAQTLIVDRKVNGGFPDVKMVKQKIRDAISPSRDLGHSDKPKQ